MRLVRSALLVACVLPVALGSASHGATRPATRHSDGSFAGSLGRPRELVAGVLAGAGAPHRRLRFHEIGPRRTSVYFDPLYAGTGSVSGRVTSIALVPGHPQQAYLGAASGGVWRTVDDGRSWTPVGDSLPVLTIGAVAVDPLHPATVWAGTGESNVFNTGPGLGPYVSHDNGRTWRAAGPQFAGCATSDLVALPGSVLLIPSDTYHVSGTACALSGVWRTTDGRSWTQVVQGPAHDLAVRGRSVWVSGGRGVGVQRSDDGGRTWHSLGLAVVPGAADARTVVDVAPDDPRRIYVAEAVTSENLLGVWTSGDGGSTWSRIPSTSQPCAVSGDYAGAASGQCLYDLDILAERQGTVLVGGALLQRFALSGTTTTVGYGGLGIHTDQHALVRDALGRLWAGNDGGVYRSPDDGRSWASLNDDLQITQLNHGSSLTSDGHVFGGSQDNGTLIEDENGWGTVIGGDGIATAAPAPHVLVGGTQGGDWEISRDDGVTWAPATTGIPRREPGAFYPPIVSSPVDGRVLWTARTRVYRTTDQTGLWLPDSPPLDVPVVTLAVSDGESPTVYAAGGSGRVWASSVDQVWVPSTTVLPGTPDAITVRHSHPREAYATVDGTGHGHLYRTTDGGLTWKDVGAGLPDVPAYAVALDGRRVYVGTYVGLFSDDGSGWVAERGGLPAVPVTDVHVRHGSVVVTTYGRGAFQAATR